jgi:hypothetical protein
MIAEEQVAGRVFPAHAGMNRVPTNLVDTKWPRPWVWADLRCRGEDPLPCRRPGGTIGQFKQHVTVARLRGAPTHQIAPMQFGKRRHQIRLVTDPGTILRDHLVTRAVSALSILNGFAHLLWGNW